MPTIKEISQNIQEDLGLKKEEEETLNESVYMKIPRQFDIITDVISTLALKEHYELYSGYIKKLNRASIELSSLVQNNSKDVDAWRAVKKEEQFLINACHLHELFFEQLGSSKNSVLNMDSLSYLEIQKTWGDFDNWQKDFINTALASNQGWCITGYSVYTNQLINICVDSHDLNIVPCIPLVAIDMFEHSYFRDFGLNKREYIFNFMKSLKWDKIEDRFEKLFEIKKLLA